MGEGEGGMFWENSIGMERETGGGIGMGNTFRSMADSCQCVEPLQYCKVISLQLIKTYGKKNNNIPELEITRDKFNKTCARAIHYKL